MDQLIRHHHIGFDVAKERTIICIIDENGKSMCEGSEKTDLYSLASYQKIGL